MVNKEKCVSLEEKAIYVICKIERKLLAIDIFKFLAL